MALTSAQKAVLASPDLGAGGRTDPQALASALAPVLSEALGGRLRDLRWFRADWQRGGAATAFARFGERDDSATRVVIKIPVGHTELMWMRRLQDQGDENLVVPRLYESGDEVGGYLLAWVVIERFAHGPLGASWREDHVPRIADAAARFWKAASKYRIDVCHMRQDWHDLVAKSRESVRRNELADAQRWAQAFKALQPRLDELVDRWRARHITDWVHGDLQPANCMCRSSDDAAPVALIDLAEVRPGHWIEDAIFFERLHWARPQRLGKYKPVREFARARRALGLPVEDGYQELAAIRRALLAATAPRFMKTEGSPAHLAACLERLENSLQEM